MKKVFAVWVFLCNAVLCLAQNNSVRLVKEFNLSGEKVFIDNLKAIYLLKNAQLLKYNTNAELIQTYSNKALGKADFCDVSNAFKIMLFYKNQNSIIFLDNTLAEISEPISLEDKGFYSACAACISAKGGFWIFDTDKQELVFFDNNLQQKSNSGALEQLIGLRIEPIMMHENGDFVYLLDKNKGLLIFDSFASFYKQIPVKDAKASWETENWHVFHLDEELYFVNKNFLSEFSLVLPENKSKDLFFRWNSIYVLTDNGLKEYEIDE